MIALHEFIRETLTQIVSGITEAQQSEVIDDSEAAIVPWGGSMAADQQIDQLVQFDIDVTTQSETEARAGIGVFVGSVTLGTSGKSDQSTGSRNRIKFAVPVQLPKQSIHRNKD